MENQNIRPILSDELESSPWIGTSQKSLPNTARHVFSLFVFAAGFIIINYKILVVDILYRWAANDLHSVIINMVAFAVQFVLLYLALVFFSTRNFKILLALLFVSAFTNVCYSQILGVPFSGSAFEWLLSEARYVGSAISEFAIAFIISFIKVFGAIALFAYARAITPLDVLSKSLYSAKKLVTAAISVAMFFIYGVGSNMGGSRGAELNLYRTAFDVITVKHPDRLPVAELPSETAKVKKIVWLVDESIVHAQFHSLSGPMLSKVEPTYKATDLGNAVSFANCSGQSNAAMRWGVNVATINSNTDLRKNPTIWAYAKAAGFRTTLIDGQVSGAPQNFIWTPERKLIDDFRPALNGIDTDRAIARTLNQMLKSDQKDFIYVVLRGAHYQYSSNYPADPELEKSSLIDRYRRAISYSKEGVFETIFQDLRRTDVAVFYTSDHGQIVEPGKVPHCNEVPDPDEFSVPLLLIAPVETKLPNLFKHDGVTQHSASQIFPTALWLMGYSRQYAEENYDSLLDKAPKAIVKFGKSMTPRSSGDPIEVKVYRSY